MANLAASLTPHIPYLRRFARALSGGQKSGDAYVVTTLETLVEDPSVFPSDVDAKVGLYQVFLKIWNSVHVNSLDAPEKGAGKDVLVDEKLGQLTPRPRQAFLLTALEEFSVEQAAQALGCTSDEIDTLIDQAGQQISLQVATDVLIIEDEPLIAMDLEDLVSSLNHRIIGVARTHKEALALAKKKTPGIVLADIQLADGSSGIDAVNDLLRSIDVPVIFITAYPERLLTGERPEPTFLITKPFQPSTVKAIMSQALFFEQTAGETAEV